MRIYQDVRTCQMKNSPFHMAMLITLVSVASHPLTGGTVFMAGKQLGKNDVRVTANCTLDSLLLGGRLQFQGQSASGIFDEGLRLMSPSVDVNFPQ